MLDHAEYVEQAYLFDLLRQRIEEALPMQELLEQLQHELLSTTRLPMAIDYMLTELRHSGMMSPAMRHLGHYFAPFQTFVVSEAEREHGRFSMPVALAVLHFDAQLRADYVAAVEAFGQPDAMGYSGGRYSGNGQSAPPAAVLLSSKTGGGRRGEATLPAMMRRGRTGFFFFQFETLCRNRLGYDPGLAAMADDPVYDATWNRWLMKLRSEVGLVDLADLLFLASEEFRRRRDEAGVAVADEHLILFGTKEGRIAFANRRKDPLYLFGAMQRHLGYPTVPRLKVVEEDRDTIPQMLRRIERLETRIKIMEQEQKESFDISKFYARPDQPSRD